MNMLRLLLTAIDKINDVVGKLGSWFILAMVLITVIDVSLRYLFKTGSVAFQELEWHLFAANFMIAGGGTMLQDRDVRIDFLSSRFSPKTKAVIEILGILFFCLPFCLVVIWSGWPFVLSSWSMGEGSPDPGGLPARYVLKFFIPLSFSLISFQAVSQLIKALFVLASKGEER